MLQFDEEVIAWTCNSLQKICLTISNSVKKKKLKNLDIKTFEKPKNIKKNKMIHYLEIIKAKQNIYMTK